MKGSIIISVLESYEVVRRQVIHLGRLLEKRPEWELIIVDDGSDPAIKLDKPPCNFQLLQTNDKRPWSQPAGRNFGAKHSKCGPDGWLLMTDIDHIFTEESIRATDEYQGHKLYFDRTWGILDDGGNIKTDTRILMDYGLEKENINKVSQHYNTFGIRKWIFEELNGYDDKYCGRHGGDDVDFSHRYGKLHYANKDRVKRSDSHMALIYVYPAPEKDVKHIFHSLRNRAPYKFEDNCL